jgi:hypothetical protein
LLHVQDYPRASPEEAFGLGLLLGQIVTHCEHILAGGKLAAQIACNRNHLAIAIDAIRKEGCEFIVDADVPERVAVWMYKKKIAATLIAELNQKNAPSQADMIVAGKLFGYSDCEIENYVTGQITASLTGASGSESSRRSDSDTDGLRKAQGCCTC